MAKGVEEVEVGAVVEVAGTDLDVVGRNLGLAKCFGLSDDQWREIIQRVAYMPRQPLDSFRQATECKPGFAEAHNALGEMLGAKGRLPEAVEQFEKAVELDGDYSLARENLEAARSLLQQRNQKE